MTAPATRLVGVLELASKYRYGLTSRGTPRYLFRPYDEERPEYAVGCSTRDTARNQIAVVEVPAAAPPPPPAKPHANLVRIIGPVGDRAAEEAGLLEHYCGTKTAAPSPPPPPDTTHDAARVELSAATGWRVFHVDPPGCRDVDDAIAWHPATDRWAVTIADAAAAVPPDSPADRAARAQGTSFYDLAGRAVRPMLPPAISEDAASLLPGQRRRGVSLIFPPPPAATAAPPLWTLSWITVADSFTYDNFAASAIATAAGATATDPHDWIADWMIRYNTAAASLLRAHGTGLLRTQSPADAATVASWPPALRHLAAEAAAYSPATTDTPEHAGLGLPAYTHASSPLRRYADLVNQRAIKAIITGDTAPSSDTDTDTIAAHLNDRTRAARRWTRDLTFLAHVEPGRVLEVAVIWLGATDNRVWVPDWKRVIRLRHEPPTPPPAPGTVGRIQIFCDPTRRNWRQRVLTGGGQLEK